MKTIFPTNALNKGHKLGSEGRKQSKKVRRVILLALLPLILLAYSAPVVHATIPAAATGNFLGGGSVLSVQSVGGNTIVTVAGTIDLSGTISGTCVGGDRIVFHPDNTFTVRGSCTFTGTVNGIWGSAVLADSANGTPSNYQGHLIVLSASNGLSGLHAEASYQAFFTGSTTNEGVYSGQFSFDPSN